LPGDLKLTAEKAPEGYIYANIPGVWGSDGIVNMASFPQYRNYPVLHGKLINGLNVVLYDAEAMAWADERAIISSRCALVGPYRKSGKTPKFNALRIQVSHMDSLYGVAPIKTQTMPHGNLAHLSGTWSVEQEPESTQVWNDSDAKLTLSYSSSVKAADAFHFRMAYSPVCVVELEKAAPLDDILKEWVDPIHRVTALATGGQEEVTYLSLRPESEGEPNWQTQLQVYGSGITQQPYTSSQSQVMKHRSAFTFKGDSVSALSITREWQAMSAAHHPLLETYGKFLIVRNQHPRARFLLLIQALEGLHGFEHKEPETEEDLMHLTEREELIQSLSGCGMLTNTQLKFLKKNLSKKPFRNLDSRLKKIFSELPEDARTALSATNLVKHVISTTDNVNSAYSALRVIRNNLAHGNRGYDASDLHEVTIVLDKVARAHTLRALGCETKIQHRVFSPNL
jgi:hypothetical protein